jgi:hypothetical protein
MKISRHTKATIAFALSSLFYAAAASANLIFDSNEDASGTGFGTQQNILTLHNSGGNGGATDTEDGTVAWDGTAQTCTGTDVVCQDGKTDLFTFGQLNIDDAAELKLVWNPNEVGSTGVQTQVDQLTATIYNPNGTTFFTASIDQAVTFQTIQGNGVGGAGFVFRLDTAETADLNTLLGTLLSADRDKLIIGLHSSVSFVDDGPDTWTIVSQCPAGTTCGAPPEPCTVDCGPQSVPEPQTLFLVGLALLGIGATQYRSYRRS